MATRTIKAKRDDTMLADWQSRPERAPSVMLEATPTLTRFLFALGLLFVFIGGLSLVAVDNFPYMVSPGWGTVFLTLGLALILVHAFTDKEEQFRRMYAVAGVVILCVSAALRVLPMGGGMGGRFVALGIPGLCVGLLVVGAVLRQETNLVWRNFLNQVLLYFAGGILLAGTVMTNLYLGSHVGEGVLLMILGLFFAVISMTFQTDSMTHGISLGLGALGVICVALGVARWFMIGMDFLVPSGAILIGMGLVYICVSLGVSSDWQVVVLTRREFSAFFYSPIAYPVLLGLTLISWINFVLFVDVIVESQGRTLEPIVQRYIVSLIPVFAQMFVVPVITMRLLSEEQRSGTLEVLLTAPVNEMAVVISKFVAALAFFLLTWMPMWLFLVSMWIFGGERFDYRPVLSFSVAVLASGAGFIAMGLFCSAITRNQIIAAVLCFAGMMIHLGLFLLKNNMRSLFGMQDVLTYMSFIDLWINSLEGLVAPRFLFFHISLAVFFLFLTLKVLESRKWK